MRQHHRITRTTGFALLLLLWGAGLGLLLAARAAEGGAGDRAEALGKLILQSSAAAQITASGEPAAMAKHQAAKAAYERALEAQRRGDADAAKRLLDEASRTMFEAVRLAKPDEVVGAKKRADYNKRVQSLEQLLQMYERIRREKQSDAGKEQVNGVIKEKRERAQALFDAGQIDQARALLDEAYAGVAVAMDKLHGGDIVTRSLNFKNKAEEYRYELDRNETHRLLLDQLLAEKSDRPQLKEQTQPFVDRAAELRQQAESAASSGGHEKAVEILEESTGQLIRALRATGIYIPG